MRDLPFVHVDVFSAVPYGGNSLAVFPDSSGLNGGQMLAITQELRHFETIFLEPARADGVVPARVFDLIEELPFAGHPILGAAGVLHRAAGIAGAATHRFALGERIVAVRAQTSDDHVTATLNAGAPSFGPEVAKTNALAAALSLGPGDLDPDLPITVVSTGLRYLVVPVRPGMLERARIATDLTSLLTPHGADYAVLLDDAGREIRHWVNDGTLEDAATGSAASCVAAYRLRHRQAAPGETVALSQGRHMGRPSLLNVAAIGTPDDVVRVEVGGGVAFVGRGVLEALP